MALEAAKGMLYLHSRVDVVLHRDLKSANLLVDKHWRVKVADFNLSRVMHASAVVSSVSATNPRSAPCPQGPSMASLIRQQCSPAQLSLATGSLLCVQPSSLADQGKNLHPSSHAVTRSRT